MNLKSFVFLEHKVMSESDKKQHVSRRDFLRMSALAVAGAAVAEALPVAAADITGTRAAATNQTEPVSLRIVSGQDVTEIDVRKKIAEMFGEVNKNVKIEIMLINGGRAESQTTMIAGGNPPDILYLNEWFQYPFMQKGVTLPLDDYVKRDNFTFEGVLPGAVEINRYKGKLMASPFEVATLAFVYNKKLFDEAKVEYPPTAWDDPNWTWDKLIEMATKLTDESKKQYGVSIENWMYWAFLFQYGGHMFNNTKETKPDTKCVIDSPEAAQAFQLETDLSAKYKVSPSSAAMQELGGFDRFMSGKVAMYAYGRWLSTFRTIKDFAWDSAPLPHVKGMKPATVLYTLNYAIYTQSKVPDVGWQFLKFLLTEGPQQANVATGMAVAVLDKVNKQPVFLESKPPERNDVYSSGLAYALPSENLDVDMTAVIQPFLDKIFNGTTSDIAGTLKEAAATVNQELDKWRKENPS